ncbi:MAG: NTP transferase domain-containing protein [Firmicutes bacterium]|nr:NTP transferase domain-containing protein [Bacillota bacterium]
MKINSVAIVAGGLGLRMRKLFDEIPKIILPINGKPFLAWVLDEFEKIGFTSIHLLLGYKASEIWDVAQKWLNETETRKNKISLSATIEPRPIGAWQSLLLAKEFLLDYFFVTYGDVFPTVNIPNMIENYKLQYDGCMAICPREIANEKGNIEINDEAVTNYNKNENQLPFVDVSAVLLNKKVLSIPFDNDKEILQQIVKNSKIQAYIHSKPSKHIGEPEAYYNFLNWIKIERGLENE